MKYCSKFFATKDEAKAFQEEKGCGALYSCAKGSRTRQSYMCEAAMVGMTMEQTEKTPFVVAWNERG